MKWIEISYWEEAYSDKVVENPGIDPSTLHDTKQKAQPWSVYDQPAQLLDYTTLDKTKSEEI